MKTNQPWSTLKVRCNGITPIMFDKFVGQEDVEPEKKLYLGTGTNVLTLPASNVMGFLNSKTSVSCAKRFLGNKERGDKCAEVLTAVSITPAEIPFLDENGAPLTFTKFDSRIYVDERMARPSKTARVIAKRPVLTLPWALEFDVTVSGLSEYFTVERIQDWFVKGGFEVGFGAYRPLFGRFSVEIT